MATGGPDQLNAFSWKRTSKKTMNNIAKLHSSTRTKVWHLGLGQLAWILCLGMMAQFVSAPKAGAAPFTASVSGNWGDSTTWGGGGIPAPGMTSRSTPA